ncbi:cuticular protein 18 [Augochlora pura]
MIRPVIVLCAVAATASAIPLLPTETPIPILEHDREGPAPDGSYTYKYQTANGIQADEFAFLRYPGTNLESLEARGSYSYTAPNGELVQVSYIANENGFQPVGSHISPEISEYAAIQNRAQNIGGQ